MVLEAEVLSPSALCWNCTASQTERGAPLQTGGFLHVLPKSYLICIIVGVLEKPFQDFFYFLQVHRINGSSQGVSNDVLLLGVRKLNIQGDDYFQFVRLFFPWTATKCSP